jgi:hypothetical protein
MFSEVDRVEVLWSKKNRNLESVSVKNELFFSPHPRIPARYTRRTHPAQPPNAPVRWPAIERKSFVPVDPTQRQGPQRQRSRIAPVPSKSRPFLEEAVTPQVFT